MVFNILLDLDQTLIASEKLSEFNMETEKDRMKLFDYHIMDNYYIIFGRPHLQSFLDYIFKKYNVSVWTAASKDYALFIIDKFILLPNKPQRKLDYVFFRYHGKLSEKLTNGPKTLKMLETVFRLPNYTMDNTFIIDDYNAVYNSQPKNCVFIPEFDYITANSEKDNALVKIKESL